MWELEAWVLVCLQAANSPPACARCRRKPEDQHIPHRPWEVETNNTTHFVGLLS